MELPVSRTPYTTVDEGDRTRIAYAYAPADTLVIIPKAKPFNAALHALLVGDIVAAMNDRADRYARELARESDDTPTPGEGPVSITLDTGAEQAAMIGRFKTIAEAETYLATSAEIDPDDLQAGRYSINTPHGVGSDLEAVESIEHMGYQIFRSMGGLYYAPPGVAGPTSNISGKGWKSSLPDDNAASLALRLLSQIEP